MYKYIVGAIAAMMMLSAGFFFWIGAQEQEYTLPEAPPAPDQGKMASDLPEANIENGIEGPVPPTPPKAYKASREELRFNRYDRDRDEVITRLELMSSRTKAFRKLDKDGNNLLTFEEWAVATSDRFEKADRNKNDQLTRSEFRTTRPKRSAPRCKC
ncbi:MAG: hypothetical protein Pars2KO_30030 [Parasphingorhabdus sp.]